MIDGAIETTAIQRAFGFTYETEKAFQTAVKMNVETVPPSENLLKFMLERRIRLEGYVSQLARVSLCNAKDTRSYHGLNWSRLGATRNGYLSGKRCTAPMEN